MENLKGDKISGTVNSAEEVVSVDSSAVFSVFGRGSADPCVFCNSSPKSTLLVAIVDRNFVAASVDRETELNK